MKVKSQKPEVLNKRRSARLEALLTGNAAKQYADPAARAKNG